MEALTVQPKTQKQLKAIKAFLKALEVDFKPVELTEREKAINLYGIDAVEAVEQGREDAKAGRTKQVKMDDMKSYLGL